MKKSKYNSQSGLSVYLVSIVIILVLAIGLGTAGLLVSQISVLRGMGHSVIALHAADTGIERFLYAWRIQDYAPVVGKDPCGVNFDCLGLLGKEANYIIKIREANDRTVVDSEGSYKNVNRALQVIIESQQ